MNHKSKIKFKRAVKKVGLNKLCKMRDPNRRERHRTKAGEPQTVLSFDNLTRIEIRSSKKIT